MLINDTTFLLDESIDALRSIRDVQKLMADEATWNATSQVRLRGDYRSLVWGRVHPGGGLVVD